MPLKTKSTILFLQKKKSKTSPTINYPKTIKKKEKIVSKWVQKQQ
jgi:hypothetical protein